MASKNAFVVLPAYNESSVVSQVIDEIKKHGYSNIIVVDDGSTDDTFKRAKEKGAIAVRHILNRGKGAAIKTGITAAKILNAERVVTFDADGQHEPGDIDKALALLDEYDVVLGRRNFGERHIPHHKKVGNFLGNVLTWMVFGLWVADSQSGMRAYSKKAMDLIDTTADRYEYDSEIMREIVRNDLSYVEMPIRVRYTEYSQKKPNRQSFSSAVETVIRLLLAR